jgi:SAM-dependent methyltransferase
VVVLTPEIAMQVYDRSFYERQGDGSYVSATIILDHLRGLLPLSSAVDVGCGAGTWVQALLEIGVSDVLGIDGAYARESLRIPATHFLAADLRQAIALDRRFDLALSMEVAEHLPPARAESFVADLVQLAPAVLFSAAIPLQGGTAHLNERWQEFWGDIFARHGYRAHDVIRPAVWGDRRVEVWYRQNALLFLAEDHPEAAAVAAAAAALPRPLSLVHPEMFPLGFNLDNKPLLLRMLYWSFARDLRRLFRRGGEARRQPATH